MKTRAALSIWLVICTCSMLPAADQGEPGPTIVEVRRIWDKAPHNAFTDLVRHEDRWYCVFREGGQHVSPDGSLRVITSQDGRTWESLALVSHPNGDLRDAKLSVRPDGRFMLNGAVMWAEREIRYQSMAWFSNDRGKTWSEGAAIGDPGFWLWRVHWRQGTAYSMGYRTDRDRSQRILRFYTSGDGLHYRPLIERVNVANGVGEDKILFLPDGSALCLLRHETGTKTAFLGKSKPPYTEWTWTDLGVRIGGPNMIRLPDGRIIAVTRLYTPGVRTSLSQLDPTAGTLTELLRLPSGGDTSYAGLVFHEGLLWISYYSSHEEKTCVYLAKVKL